LIFVDTNILIDVAIGNPAWADWSHQALASDRARGPLLINAAVYAEFAMAHASGAAAPLATCGAIAPISRS
jgi:predicted nucleic acid-binding protein